MKVKRGLFNLEDAPLSLFLAGFGDDKMIGEYAACHCILKNDRATSAKTFAERVISKTKKLNINMFFFIRITKRDPNDPFLFDYILYIRSGGRVLLAINIVA